MGGEEPARPAGGDGGPVISADALCRMFSGLDEAELARWIEQRWVVPHGGPDAYQFEEIDVARVRLIVEMRQEMSIDDETLPTVLSLLDQVYSLREQLRAVYAAVAAQPDDVKRAIEASLRRS